MELYTDAAFSDVHTVAKAAGGLRTFVKTSQKNIEKRLAKVEELPFKTLITLNGTHVPSTENTDVKLTEGRLATYILALAMSKRPTSPGLYKVTVVETTDVGTASGRNSVKIKIGDDGFVVNDDGYTGPDIGTGDITLGPIGTGIQANAVVTSIAYCFISFRDESIHSKMTTSDVQLLGEAVANKTIHIIDF